MIKKSKGRKFLVVISLLLLLSFIAFALWAMLPHRTMEAAKEALKSDETVAVQNGTYIHLKPLVNRKKIGIIMYPGARVDAEAYAVLGKKLAREGMDVFILKMPLRIAFFGVNAADRILNEHKDELSTWYIGGHSLGGVVAANYAVDHQETIDGVIFLASYPVKGKDFKNADLRYLQIFASKDGFVTKEDRENGAALLPAERIVYTIEGGNHEQFGYYGHQKGDGIPDITREEQHEVIKEQISAFVLN
ncbi:thioesterase [Anaerocolumna cellulosilytica]|uniref:Thioesterase n=1 Tax=Anaerocolumna cellulosilytica TaxID=433286 RepID=A0A6S6R4R9_9FIRM|nr:alpha/beta hydrolase [Anaerocolumna cellulosilytica]MBB5197251.1 hypothetical protein [Anaerocolumna cellulosilytica]BCJ94058.1 thioesterase [Anaerocolumna cellulosilytica]